MGAGASAGGAAAPYETVEAALAAGKTQEECDKWQADNKGESKEAEAAPAEEGKTEEKPADAEASPAEAEATPAEAEATPAEAEAAPSEKAAPAEAEATPAGKQSRQQCTVHKITQDIK